MKHMITFRTDASLQIGTGHVMRCLTLADALAARGATCQFICRAHEGNLIDFIRDKGYVVHALPVASDVCLTTDPAQEAAATSHAGWLGATQAQDAGACAPILAARRPDWLIVDHYALDATWERALAPHCARLMVIDDLADRPHVCDLLLDQTHGRDEADYRPHVPASCRLLCGAQYALLRPEFAALRPYSLARRTKPALRELLVTMGGVDKDNATGQVLRALRTCPLPPDCRITVVMGVTAPWLEEVRSQAQVMPWPTRVLVGVKDMAQLMADSDLAIGAAGATSWERCCLGVPTVMLVLAENQRKIAEELCDAGAAHLIDSSKLKNHPLLTPDHLNPILLGAMSAAAAAVTDGLGVAKVIEVLICKTQHANQLAV
jgi:UDP-2,4-diacetamido-2,4,6-trideoxy-beta-L-altropyranose hydrolase